MMLGRITLGTRVFLERMGLSGGEALRCDECPENVFVEPERGDCCGRFAGRGVGAKSGFIF